MVGGDEDGGHPEYGEDAEPDVGSGWLWVVVVHMEGVGIVSLEWGGERGSIKIRHCFMYPLILTFYPQGA